MTTLLVLRTLKLQQTYNNSQTKWVCNSWDVLGRINEYDQTQSKPIDFNESEALKALGICWNREN